jgi:hypothetical protein
MEEVIWIEIMSRHREVVQRHRCAGHAVRIGRAYTNDVIIDDPFVAPEHVVIWRSESGALVVEDLGSGGGLYDDRKRSRMARLTLDGDRAFRIGQTLVRVRLPNHAVAPARIPGRGWHLWPVLVALAAAVSGIEAGAQWLGDFTRPTLNAYLQPQLVQLALVLGWAGCWSLACRIFAGRPRFEINLLVTLAALLVYRLYGAVIDLAAESLAWQELASYRYVGVTMIVAAACLCHLRVIGPARQFAKAATIGALAALVIGQEVLSRLDERYDFLLPNPQASVTRFLPPAMRLAAPQSEQDFFADVDRLRERLEQDRQRPVP